MFLVMADANNLTGSMRVRIPYYHYWMQEIPHERCFFRKVLMEPGVVSADVRILCSELLLLLRRHGYSGYPFRLRLSILIVVSDGAAFNSCRVLMLAGGALDLWLCLMKVAA